VAERAPFFSLSSAAPPAAFFFFSLVPISFFLIFLVAKTHLFFSPHTLVFGAQPIVATTETTERQITSAL
jgi:hypothetical protein